VIINDSILRANIRELIDTKGLKHSKIAGDLGMSKSTFSGMLCGRKTIKAVYIPDIAKSIGCTYNDLFRRPEEPQAT
jgi:transcriptional regulator with XRE-family HTH domain